MGPVLRLDPGALLVNLPLLVLTVGCLVIVWRRWLSFWLVVLAIGTTWTIGGYLAPLGPVVLTTFAAASRVLGGGRSSAQLPGGASR
jgi:hypothetical protein